METLAVVVVVSMVLFVGCSGGIGPTLPSPDGPHNDAPVNDTPINDTPVNDTPVNDTPINDTPVNDTPTDGCPDGGDLSGTVTTSPLLAGVVSGAGAVGSFAEGVMVAATDGVKVEQTFTDENGFFCLDGFEPGEIWLAYSLRNYGTEYVSVQFDGNPRDDLHRNLASAHPFPGDQSECPELTTYFYDPRFTDEAELRGSISNSGTNAVVAFYEGDGTLVEWELDLFRPRGIFPADQDFSVTVDDEQVLGDWAIFAANASCAILEPVPSQTETGGVRMLLGPALLDLEDLTVKITVAEDDVRVETPDEDGSVEFDNLPPGTYDVILDTGAAEMTGPTGVEIRGGVMLFLGRVFVT
jgi:hypothetical protein